MRGHMPIFKINIKCSYFSVIPGQKIPVFWATNRQNKKNPFFLLNLHFLSRNTPEK